MMRRLLFLVLSCLCLMTPAKANIKIETDVVSSIVPLYFPAKKDATSAVAAFVDAVKANGDGTISADDLWKVCTAGGLDIKKTADKQKCEDFVYQMVKASVVTYYEVCGAEAGKGVSAGGKEECVNELFKNVRVTVAPAAELAKEYATIKYNDNTLKCAQEFRTEKREDYLKCTSIKENKFYEFRFDTIDAFQDKKIQDGIIRGVCKIHGTDVRESYYFGNVSRWENVACRTSSAEKCKAIDKSLAKFGYTADLDSDLCKPNFNTISKPEQLKNDFKDQGIDSFYFCRNSIQITNNLSFQDAIVEYLSSNIGVSESQIECAKGAKPYTGRGCATKWTNYRDDVISCTVNGKEIDLVFDDVNEWTNIRRKGGTSGMQCLIVGGEFDGRQCRLLGEDNCKVLAKGVEDYCPECTKPFWNGTTCQMPDAASVDTLNKSLTIATDVGLAAAGVVLFFIPGGQAGSIAILSYIAGGLVVAGATGRVTSNIVMQTGIFRGFADEAEACNNEECAKKLLKEGLQKMASYKKEFTYDEQRTLDALFDHLFNQIPATSDFWYVFMSNPELFDPVTCELKTKKQLWQYVRQWSEIAEIAGALLNIGNVAFTKTNNTVVNKVDEAVYAFGKHGDKAGTRMTVFSVATREAGKTQTSKYLARMGYKYGSQLTDDAARAVLTEAGINPAELVGAVFTNGQRASIRLASGRVIPTLLKVPVTTTQTVTKVTLNMAGIVNPAWLTIAETTGSGVYYGAKTADGYAIPPCLQQDPYQGIIEIVDVEEEDIPGNGGGGGSGVTNPDVGGGDTPDIPGTTPTIPTEPSGTTSPVLSSPDMTESAPVSERFRAQKSKNTGLIAAAAVLGTVATGGLIGSLVVASDKGNKKADVSDITIDSDLETLMQNAQNSFGTVGKQTLRLKPLPTIVNSNAPIVLINGKPVVVVAYNSRKIPFYMHGTTWLPLLGIGDQENYFNVYPTSDNLPKNPKMEAITNALNASFNPAIVARYAGEVPGALSFPTAKPTALMIINSEFTDGVVQSANMSEQDRKLYSSNYQKIQEILK